MLLICSIVLAACGLARLDSPINLAFDEAEQELTWDQVENSTGGYKLEITGAAYYKEHEIQDYWHSVANLETGEYIARVKAITIDYNFYSDSNWSRPLSFKIERESGITYTLINDGSEYEVYKLGSARGDIVIFEKYMGKPITSIAASAFSASSQTGASYVTGIVIGNNVTKIGNSAFSGCIRLERVVFPKNLTSIGSRAFQNCLSLTSMVIPNTVTSLGERAFGGCRALESVTLSDNMTSVGTELFYDCVKLENLIIGKKVTSIGASAFAGCAELKAVTLPDCVTDIGDYAFSRSGIESITLPFGITRINKFTFNSCQNLSVVRIPDSLTSIGERAFVGTAIWENNKTDIVYADRWVVGCKNQGLSNAELEEGTVGICEFAFSDFEDLVRAKIPDSVMNVGYGAFAKTGIWKNSVTDIIYVDNKWAVGCKNDRPSLTDYLLEVNLPSSVVGIGDYAFYGRSYAYEDTVSNLTYYFGLQKVTLPVGLKSIGAYAFYGCFTLEGIMFPVGLKSIGAYAFYGCSRTIGYDYNTEEYIYLGLPELTIPNSVTNIGAYAFARNSRFKQITIPSSITSISDGVFFRNTSASSITIPSSVTSIGNRAFYACYSATSITIPNSVTNIGNGAFLACTGLTSIIIPGGVTSIGDETFANCTNLANITIPNSVTSIGNRAFEGCSSLTSITIPDSVTSIGDEAFFYCNFLTSIVIPDGVTRIGNGTFRHCWFLDSITLPAGLKSIGDQAFADCYYMTNRLIIPEGVTRIGRYAFLNCRNMQGIVLPGTLTSIGDYAFTNCGLLTSVTIGNNLIGMGSHVFYSCKSLTIYCEANWRRENWSVHWNSSLRPVIWSCTLSEDKSYVVSFIKTETSISYPKPAEEEVGIFEPYRKDYVFLGWAIAAEGEIPDYTADTVNDAPDDIILYAIWVLAK